MSNNVLGSDIWRNLSSPVSGRFQNFLVENKEKWVPAAMIGIFGSGMAYLWYRRKLRRDNPIQHGCTLKQLNKRSEEDRSWIQLLPPEVK